MRIQHNIMAMNAYRNYTGNVSAMQKNLEKLSSGYKINRAGDDAAGLAISEKMRAQITGLETAQKNAKDGISLVQTAEGALTEVHDMLNRMVTLATQSANGTYDNDTDRVQLQKELDQLRSEINRIADSANFNGIKLLDGSLAASSTSALGSTAAQILDKLSVDGSIPSKAGAAEITVDMRDGSALAAKTIKGTSTDGADVIPGTQAEFTIQVGGQGAISDFKIESKTTKVTIGGKAYDVAATNTTAVAQATAWVNAFNADDANAAFVASDDGAGNITIKSATDGAYTGGDTAFRTALQALGVADAGATFTDGDATPKPAQLALTAFTTASTTAGAVKTTTVDADDLANFDLSQLAQGDVVSFKAGGKDFSYTVGTAANNAAAITDLTTKMAADGFTLNGGTANASKLEVAKSEITGFGAGAGTDDISAGDSLEDLLDATLNTSGVKIGDYFDVEITKAAGGTATSSKASDLTYAIQNGDTIKLKAKYGGSLTDTKIETDLKALADKNAAALTGTNANKVTTKFETTGSDEGKAASSKEVSRYTLTFDMTKLNAGQTIEIDGKTFKFVTEASTPAATGVKEIVLSTADGNSDGSNYDEVADAIKTAITDATNGLGTTNWSVNADSTKYDADKKTYTLVLETKDGVDAADNTNQGAGRVTVGTPEGGKPPITVAYDRAGYVEDPAAATVSSPFATATYEDATLKNLAVGDKIYIGDAEIEIVANDAENLTAKQIKLDDVDADGLAKVIEQQKPEFGQGKVKFDLTNGKIEITGTTVGQTGAALKKQIGDVKILDKSANTSSASTAESANDAMKITAGDTQISELLGAKLSTGQTLGDIFDITVNGNAKDDNYIIQEGDSVKFTAKVAGQLDDKVMADFAYAGDITNLTSANGYDEGSNASGNKTRYNLTIDLAAVAGGNSFTFGNVNGKSVTFDLSYDNKNTGNNTVGATDKDDISNSDSERVNINLFGLNTADAQQKIYEQVQKKMEAAGFNVSRSTSGNKITLNLEAKEEGVASNLGNIRYSSQSGAFSNSVYQPAGGSAGGVEGTHAKVGYTFDASKLQAGDSLTIGGATVNFVDGETGTINVGGKIQFNVNIAEAKADPNGKLTQMLESAGFKAGQIRFDTENKTMTIEGTTVGQTAADLQTELGNIKLTSTTNRAMESGGLKLQIGDTAENFNQMIVSIGDCHTAALNIADISIANQDSAAKAIDTIKAAINQVSDVRGTLGATQNRLDHTINNLSVMQENIQDAESTIRDTDVAEEMMAYTKNNILIQSAQAMLAQANQVPQGVLQLLQ